MSEKTFRAVVALVLVAALALAIVVAAVVVFPRSNEPLPSAATTASPVASLVSTVAPTRIAGPVFTAPDVVSVGLISRGTTSGLTLVLQFTEARVDAIPDAPGSFRVTLADHLGDGSTVAFVGTPSVGAPGSLGATATFVARNVLMISIEASDTLNIEPIRITGLGISASSTTALGSVSAELGDFTGSLVADATRYVLASPGTVIANS